jgi:hypothetical protein
MIPFHQIGRSKLSGLHVAAAAAAHKLVVISVQDNNSRCFFFPNHVACTLQQHHQLAACVTFGLTSNMLVLTLRPHLNIQFKIIKNIR